MSKVLRASEKKREDRKCFSSRNSNRNMCIYIEYKKKEKQEKRFGLEFLGLYIILYYIYYTKKSEFIK
jgi:hypothetical protein